MLVDFHSHILPGIDDGSASVAQSLAMLEAEARQGIRTVVATPHFYARHEDPWRFLEKRAQAEQKLRCAVKGRPELPQILLGAEVYYFPGMSDSEILPKLTIAGGRCILVEMPPSPWNSAVYRELEQIYRNRNIIPVVAHVERYIRPFCDYGIPRRLAQLPVMVQANASFFLNPLERRKALRLLKEDKIQLLGSDCHNMENRLPVLGDAVRVISRRCDGSVLKRIEAYQNMLLFETETNKQIQEFRRNEP